MTLLYLQSRVRRRLPEAYKAILDSTGGVTRKGFDGKENRLKVLSVYTARASSEFVEHASVPHVIIDFRFVDFALELVSASESEGTHQAAGVMFALYRLLLEQTLEHPCSSLQHGGTIDFVVSRISARSQFGWEPAMEHDLGRVEYASKLVVAHEMAHAWLACDASYLKHLLGFFEREIAHQRRIALELERDEVELVLQAAQEAHRLVSLYYENGQLHPDLEELLCDYVMVQSAAEAAVATPARQQRLFTYLSLSSSVLTALWVVPLVRRAVSSVVRKDEAVDLQPDFIRTTRTVLASMTFFRVAGTHVEGSASSVSEKLSTLWADVADFEKACVASISSLLAADNLVRIDQISLAAQELGLAPMESAPAMLRKALGW